VRCAVVCAAHVLLVCAARVSLLRSPLNPSARTSTRAPALATFRLAPPRHPSLASFPRAAFPVATFPVDTSRGHSAGSDGPKFAAFHRGMLQRGVYLAPSPFEAGFMSLAHTDADVDAAVAAAHDVLAAMPKSMPEV